MKKTCFKISICILLFFLLFPLAGSILYGGFINSDQYFNNQRFHTVQSASFYLGKKINDYFQFYTRLSSGIKYFADYDENNNVIDHLSVIVNIDLLYFQFKTNQLNPKKPDQSLFFLKIGRIPLIQGSGFLFNLTGDGFDSYFTLKNFRFRFFSITNSLDFQRFFDFQSGHSRPVFTQWDRKRFPLISNYYIPGHTKGFISQVESNHYNFYFDNDLNQDYRIAEKIRLNQLREQSILAGRIFPGFSLELFQFYFQNFGLHFLANIDLVPTDFIVTYPSLINHVTTTFGGRYTSFYINFNAHGKIWRGLYYALDLAYETGINATYYDDSFQIKYYNALINSFAIQHKISYFFRHKTKPALHLQFLYAHGDQDSQLINGLVSNRQGDDHSFHSPTYPKIGYVLAPLFSNLIVLSLSHSIKPLGNLKNPIFSRFSIESAVLLIMRPFIKGSSFLDEKSEYLKDGVLYESPDKIYLGVEVNQTLSWRIFSDLAVVVKGGIFIPNYQIYSLKNISPQTVLWRAGIGLNISF